MFDLLLLSGGIGSRVGADRPKQLLMLDGQPVIAYALRAADRAPAIDHIVLNHPAGWQRPFKAANDFRAIASHPHPHVTYALPLPFTVAPVNPDNEGICGTLERGRLRNIQLPQKYRREDLAMAHEQARRQEAEFTDDVSLCAHTGLDVRFMPGREDNIKITSAGDLALAEFLLTRVRNDTSIDHDYRSLAGYRQSHRRTVLSR